MQTADNTAMLSPAELKEGMRRIIAVHEAGHAVIGRVLKVPCGECSIADGIACDFDTEAACLGVANICGDLETQREWQRLGRRRRPRTVWIAQAMAFMAGAEGERAFFGENIADGEGRDLEQIEAFLFDAPPWVESRLRSFTRTLVRRHLDSILAVAERLLRDVTLTDADIRSAIRLARWRDCGRLARTAPV
jgi:hypothetical protein